MARVAQRNTGFWAWGLGYGVWGVGHGGAAQSLAVLIEERAMTEPLLNLATRAGREQMAAKILALGVDITPPMIMGTVGLYGPHHAQTSTDGVRIVRDLQYGPDARHRLDIFAPQGVSAARLPVLMYVHGGGFVGGDKKNPGSPFYDNVGLWAVKHGCVGVTMTYRLAPANKWPAGADDVAAATRYLREHIGEYGGDMDRLYLMGQSAGATHVGSYLARTHSSKSTGWRPAGAVLASGMFDTHTMDKNSHFEAYFGADPALYADRPFLADLAGTATPLLAVIGEYEPLDFLRQHVLLQEAYLKRHGRLPYVMTLVGHNHLSTVQHLGTADESLSTALTNFMKL